MAWPKPWVAAGCVAVDKMRLDPNKQPMLRGDAQEVLNQVVVALTVQKPQGQKCIT